MSTTLTELGILRLLRFALSGAVLGLSVAGLIGSALGYNVHYELDAVGAGAGFVAVAGAKISHLL